MRTPPLLRFARPLVGDDLPTPGQYDPQQGLRTIDSPDGQVPIASRLDCAHVVTRTDVARERDDVDPSEPLASRETLGQRDLLVLLTKTLTHRERDDE